MSEGRRSPEERRAAFMAERRQARVLAMQVLFEADFTRKPIGQIIERRLTEDGSPERVASYAEYLVRGAWEHRSVYDDMIARAAPTWPLEQMARVDRNIMRLAVFEMLDSPQVPVRAAINEAVELAKEFGSETSRRFINGVLGTIAAEYAGADESAVAPNGQ